MLQKMKKMILNAAALSLMLAPVAAPVAVSAAVDLNCTGLQGCLDAGACPDDSTGDCAVGSGADRVSNIITVAINLFSLVVGIIAVIMIIVGGLKYITSGGDSGNVTGAKNTILYAVVGLVIVALAQVVVRFVLDKAGSQ